MASTRKGSKRANTRNQEGEASSERGLHDSHHASRQGGSNNRDENQMPLSPPRGERLDRIERALEVLITHVSREDAEKASGSVSNRPSGSTLEQFQRQRPPMFRGRACDDPSVAEYWLERIDKLLHHLQCPEEDKVNCATFMLEEEASRWWQTTERALRRPAVGSGSEQGEGSSQPSRITWDKFKEAFNAKYYPRAWREAKRSEFMKLKQLEDMTVTQYDTKFVQLIKYVPMYASDDYEKAQKFLGGLKPELQRALSTWEIDTYEEALSKALTTERNLLKVDPVKPEEGRDRSESRSGSRNFRDGKRCPRCRKHHSGRRCGTRKVTCYSCGQEGHMERECPKKNEIANRGNQSRIICYQCKQPGHMARDCPKRPRSDQAERPRAAGQAERPSDAQGARI